MTQWRLGYTRTGRLGHAVANHRTKCGRPALFQFGSWDDRNEDILWCESCDSALPKPTALKSA